MLETFWKVNYYDFVLSLNKFEKEFQKEDELKKIHEGSIDLKTAVDAYEAEMRPRTHEAVLKSRAAALIAHEWDQLTMDSPVVGARTAPLSAFK